jgi:6-phosphogluconate dehydrogenase
MLTQHFLCQRAALQDLVQSLAKPKVIAGEVLNGAGLAFLVEQMVDALNARDIPTAGSILEHFNKDLVYRVRIQPEALHRFAV